MSLPAHPGPGPHPPNLHPPLPLPSALASDPLFQLLIVCPSNWCPPTPWAHSLSLAGSPPPCNAHLVGTKTGPPVPAPPGPPGTGMASKSVALHPRVGLGAVWSAGGIQADLGSELQTLRGPLLLLEIPNVHLQRVSSTHSRWSKELIPVVLVIGIRHLCVSSS